MKPVIHVVGGAVRDRLLGRPILDVDLILPIDPEPFAKKLAKKLGGSAFVLDRERKIFRVTLPTGIQLDFAKWQGKTLEADLDRRDFTINSLAVPLAAWMESDWKNSIIDRHGGLKDLEKKIIVPVSKKIIQDDPLRLLRAFRISAELDFSIHSTTVALIKKFAGLIKKPAPERKREEMLRMFSTPHAAKKLYEMESAHLLDKVFPDAIRLKKTAPAYYGKGGVLKHTLDSVQCFEDIVADPTWFPDLYAEVQSYLNEKIGGYPRLAHCKWGLLLHDIGKPDTMKVIDGRLRFFEHEHVGAKKVSALASQYRWSGTEVSKYENYVRHHMRPGNLAVQKEVSDKAVHRFFRDLGDDAIAMLLISLGDHLTYLTPKQKQKRNSPHEKTTIKMIRQYYTHREKIVPPKILDGHDIMKAFKLKPSPLIGALLTDLSEAQSEKKILNKRDALGYLKGRIRWHEKKILG